MTLRGIFMKRFSQVLISTIFSLGCVGSALAQTAQENIRKMLESKLNGLKIEGITKTQVPSLYEVRIGGDLVYVDESGKYMLQGNLMDLANSKNLTRERTEQLQAEADKAMMPVLWSDATLKNAVKLVKGNGKRKMVVFEDPNCGYCKKLRQSIENISDVTVYTFVIPILSEDSSKKTRDLWCSADRQKAYDDWMLRGKIPVTAAKSCEDVTDESLELSQRLKVRGTPAIFFADGSRVPGFLPPDLLEKRLATAKAVF